MAVERLDINIDSISSWPRLNLIEDGFIKRPEGNPIIITDGSEVITAYTLVSEDQSSDQIISVDNPNIKILNDNIDYLDITIRQHEEPYNNLPSHMVVILNGQSLDGRDYLRTIFRIVENEIQSVVVVSFPGKSFHLTVGSNPEEGLIPKDSTDKEFNDQMFEVVNSSIRVISHYVNKIEENNR